MDLRIFLLIICYAAVLAHGGTGHSRQLLRGGEGGGRAEGGGDAGVRAEAGRADPSAGASASDAALRATPGTLSDPGDVGSAALRADDRAAREALGPLLYQDLGLYPDDALATLTADDTQLVQAQVGTVASVVHGVSDKNDPSCNGAQCNIPTQGFTCDQAVVYAHTAKWCMTKTAAQCGSIQGTTMFNETAATAQLDAVAGAFAGMPWSAVGAGVAAAQAQLQAAYSSTVINAGPVPVDVVEDALSTLGTEFRTKTACGMRIVLRADMAPSATKDCLYCACGAPLNASVPYIEWKLASPGCEAGSAGAAAPQMSAGP